jgi:hypothetical protein
VLICLCVLFPTLESKPQGQGPCMLFLGFLWVTHCLLSGLAKATVSISLSSVTGRLIYEGWLLLCMPVLGNTHSPAQDRFYAANEPSLEITLDTDTLQVAGVRISTWMVEETQSWWLTF